MSKILLLSLLFLSLLLGSSIDKKIKDKKRQLSSKKIQYNKMDKKLSTIAKKILNAKSERSKLDSKLNSLAKNIKNNQTVFNELSGKKKTLDKKLIRLSQEIDEKKEKFVALVADKFSMALVLEELDRPTAESVMLQEAYGVYAEENNIKINQLREEIEGLKEKETYFVNKQAHIKESISNHKKEQNEYKAKKDKKTKIIKELARDKAIYKKRFDSIRSSRRSLQKKLAKLKIIKHEKEMDRQERKKARAKAKKGRSGGKKNSTRTASYHGGKTISPLSGSRLIKKFGTYVDPIYKFKIFNKSITLKAPHKGSKVKSVLRGKIVFAENSGGMLGKVVIVSHPNNLHTIYAKLSRLAPGIHVGKSVSKGSVLGKVSSSLMFEVTKNNKHMNPLKLIRL